MLLEHLAFRNLTWITYGGIAVAFDGEIDFDPHWRPRQAELRRPGITPGFTLALTREADAERWQTRIQVGGGTAHGNLALKTAANGVMHLSGQLTPHQVEVASALSSFNRRSPVGGKGSGQTVLQELTGQMDTQNTDEGMRVTYTGIKARAGKYTVTCEATVYHRQIAASGNLDLVEGAHNNPLRPKRACFKSSAARLLPDSRTP